jgi:AraC-like DNA-binding protein
MREVNKLQKIDKLHPVKINAFETHQLNYPLHYHSAEYELTLVLGGQGLRIAGDSIMEFKAYDLVLIGPGIPHCWINEDDDDIDSSSKSIQVITVHFNRHILGDELLNRSEFNHISNLFSLSEKGLVFGKHTTSRVLEKFLQFKLEPDFDTFLNILNIFNQLATVGDYNPLCSNKYNYRGKHEEMHKFESVFHHIQSNFLQKIKITDVAALAYMNDSAFSHYFKKRTRYSFTDFVNLLRLNHAARQIITQQKNIAEICFDSGFNNLSNFNRMFKKWKGETPLQYRKKRINAVLND